MQRLALRWRLDGIRIGFVPTMGFLHEGHVSLIRRARKAIGPKGRLVVSIYVNPAQFGPNEDFSRYPRNLNHDRALCQKNGADVIFVPADDEMYPAGANRSHSTYVVEERLGRGMEGASRPTHFRGVTTIVAKLFNLVLPEIAVFGEKDFQQVAIIRRMVRDLNFPVKIITAPVYREPDGLALSSRNKYLSTVERQQATVLWEAIQEARAAVEKLRKPLPALELRERLTRLILSRPSARLDYIAFFDPETLEVVRAVKPGVRMALAVFIGRTRLIDNARL